MRPPRYKLHPPVTISCWWPSGQVRSLHRQNLSSTDGASHLSQPWTVSLRDYPHPSRPASAAIALGLVVADGGWTKIENVNPLIKINGDNRSIGSVYVGRWACLTSSTWRDAWRHPRDVTLVRLCSKSISVCNWPSLDLWFAAWRLHITLIYYYQVCRF